MDRALLAIATNLPASLGRLIFTLEQPWFWKHIPIQFAWGMNSTFLSAYALATSNDVRIFALILRLGSAAYA